MKPQPGRYHTWDATDGGPLWALADTDLWKLNTEISICGGLGHTTRDSRMTLDKVPERSRPLPSSLQWGTGVGQMAPEVSGHHREPPGQREEPGNPGRAGPTPSPGARRRRGRRLPPETRSRCVLRCQHSWKVTPSRRERRGLSPPPDVHGAQLPPANKVSSWLRQAAHTRPPPPGRHPPPRFLGWEGGPLSHWGGPEPPLGAGMGRKARPGEVGTPSHPRGRSRPTALRGAKTLSTLPRQANPSLQGLGPRGGRGRKPRPLLLEDLWGRAWGPGLP